MRDIRHAPPRKHLLLVTPPVAVAATVALLLFIVAFIFWDASGRYREALAAERERAAWSATLAARQIERQVEAFGHALDRLTTPGSPLPAIGGDEGAARLRAALQALITAEPMLDMAAAWDAAGIQLAAARREAGSAAEAPWPAEDSAAMFAAAARPSADSPHLAAARLGAPGAPRHVVLASRWTGAPGAAGAQLLAVGIAAERLGQLFVAPMARSDALLALYLPDGTLLYPPASARQAGGEPEHAARVPGPVAAAMKAADAGSVQHVRWPDGTMRIAAFQRLPHQDIAVVVGASEAAADEAYSRALGRNPVARLVVMGLIAIVGIALVRRTRHQRTLLGRISLWEQAAESSTQPVLVLDAQAARMPVTYANPAYEAVTGLSRADATGRPCPLLAEPDADGETLARLLAALAAGDAFHGEIALRHAGSGAAIALLLDLDPVHDAQGVLTNFICRLRDVTDRHRAAQAERAAQMARDWAVDELRKALDRVATSESRFRDFASSASDWFWETDASGTLVWLSDGAQVLPGWRVGEVPPVPQLRGPAAGDAGVQGDFRGERVPGQGLGGRQVLEVSGRPVPAADGTCIGYRGVVKDITAQEGLAAAARRDELRLAEAVEHLPIGLLVLDPENRVLLCNARYCDLFQVDRPARGDEPAALLGQLVARLRGYHEPATVDAIVAEWRRLAAQGQGSMTLSWPGGRTYRMEQRWHPSGDRTVVVVDVTELEESRARLLDAVQNITSGFAIFDASGHLVLGNAAFYDQITPYLPDAEIDDMTASEIFGQVAAAGVFRLMQIDGRPASPEEIATRVELAIGDPFLMTTPDGRTLQVRLRQSGDGGRVVIYSDVSLLRQMDAALRSSEAKFRGLAQASSDGIMIVDPSGEVQFANEQARLLFGYDDEDMAFDNISSLIPDESQGRHESLMAEFFAAKRSRAMSPGRPLRAVRRDGSDFPVEVALSYYETPDGPLAQATIRDITMRLRAEDAERQRAKMVALGTLAGGIAHDLNNALVPILSLSELLLDSGTASPEDAEMLGTIVAAAERARDLVRNILAFSRRGVRRVATLDLGAVVAKDLPMLRAVIPVSIALDYQVPDEQVLVAADETNLHQVVVNLVSNAAQAIGAAAGEIRIAVAAVEHAAGYGPTPAPGRYAQLSIADNGPGMDEETRQRLFEPFFTTKPVGEGTGLGLAIVHGIVGSHGGTIAVDSAPGRGTTFTIWFPLRQRQGAGDGRSEAA